MSDEISLDLLALLGVVVVFLGLWAIWPPMGVVAFGITLLVVTIGLAVMRARRKDEP